MATPTPAARTSFGSRSGIRQRTRSSTTTSTELPMILIAPTPKVLEAAISSSRNENLDGRDSASSGRAFTFWLPLPAYAQLAADPHPLGQSRSLAGSESPVSSLGLEPQRLAGSASMARVPQPRVP